MKPKYTSKLRSTCAGASLITAITFCIGSTASVNATTWLTTGTSDWNTNTNWSGGAGTGGTNAIISLPGPPTATISANIVATPVDILVGDASGVSGRLIHTAGTATTGTNNWMVVGRTGGTGVYDLADTAGTGGAFSGYGTGSGSMTVGNTGTGGRLYVGSGTGSVGTVNINTTGTLITRNDLAVGDNNGVGTVNFDAGTVTDGGWNFFGSGGSGAGVGNFKQSGGTLTNTGRTYVGNGNSLGHFTMTGGSHTCNDRFMVGANNLANAAASTIVLSGGTLNTPLFTIGGEPDNPGKGTGTISGTATLNVNGELWLGQGTGSSGSLTMSGGTVNVNNWVAIGRGAGTGTLNMSGGTINKSGGGNFIVGASGPATMTMTGGLVDITSGIFWAGEDNTCILDVSGTSEIRVSVMTLAQNGSSVGTVGLDGGTLKTTQITGGGGTAEMDFNGGQIIATAAQPSFITNLDVAKIEAGGMKIDSNGFNLTIGQILTGTGDLTKSGAGTLKLSAANTYAGNNIVSGGKLYANNQTTGTGNFTIANGAGLGVTSVDDFSQLTSGTVTFGTSAATTLDFDLGSFVGNPSAASLKVTSLVANGPVTINVADASPDVGTIPLIEYTSKTLNGSGAFVLGTLPLGVVATLQDTGTAINLVVTSVALPRWDGSVAGGIWDINTTANWVDQISNLTTTYKEGNPVLFDDQLSGTPDVVLNVTVNPGSVTFSNNIASYTLTGTGSISGTAGLTVNGTGTLTLGTTNNYTGVTSLEGGITTVSTALTNGGVASAIGAASSAAGNLVFGGGTLNYTGPAVTTNRGFTVSAAAAGTVSTLSTANDLTFTGQVTAGTFGRFTKLGAGTLTLSNAGANTLAAGANGAPATYRVDQGTVTLTGGGTFTSTGEFWVGSTTTSGANLIVSGATLTTNTWFSIGRGNGTTGLSSSATFTNATASVGNMSLGFDAGVASHMATSAVTIHNSTFTNTGATLIAEGLNSTGSMVVSGTSVVTLNDRFLCGLGDNSVATVTIQDSGAVTKTGGWLAIGNSGTGQGTMNVKNSGSLTSNGDFNVGDVGTSQGFLNISDSATVTSSGLVFIGKNTGTAGTLALTGGSMNAGSWFSVARYASSIGTVTVSGGSLNQTGTGQAMTIGEEGTGTLTISGTGTVSVAGASLLVTNNATGNGTVNLDGGTLLVKQVVAGAAGAGTSAVNLNGGLLKAATGANADFMNTTLDTVTVKAGGAKIDSNGNNITITSQLLDGGTGGGLTKSGAGALYLNGVNTYTGATVVSAGTLGGTGTIAGSVSVSAGANLSPGVTTGALNVDSATFASTATLTIDINNAASPNVDTLDVVGNLNISNATLVLNGTPTLPVYVIASYGSRTGTFASTPVLPSGYSIDYTYNGGTQIAIKRNATAYETWIDSYFPGETDPNIVGFAADPDGDGSSNVLEFALGGAPDSGSNNPKIYNIIGDSSDVGTAKELLMTIAVRSATPAFTGSPSPSATLDGITCTVQGTLDLGTFTSPVSVVTPVTTGLPAVPSGYTYRTFSLNASDGVPNKGFLRVQVIGTP